MRDGRVVLRGWIKGRKDPWQGVEWSRGGTGWDTLDTENERKEEEKITLSPL